jgi:cell division control protein 45
MLLPHIRAKFNSQGHVPLDVIWQAIIGLTDQFQHGRIAENYYDDYCHYVRTELSNHLTTAREKSTYFMTNNEASATNNANGTAIANSVISLQGARTNHIDETSDYRFYLYRHWSLYESMLHSSYIASRFSVWTADGRKQLDELFAKIGVPMSQATQLYQSMSPGLRYVFYSFFHSFSHSRFLVIISG